MRSNLLRRFTPQVGCSISSSTASSPSSSSLSCSPSSSAAVCSAAAATTAALISQIARASLRPPSVVGGRGGVTPPPLRKLPPAPPLPNARAAAAAAASAAANGGTAAAAGGGLDESLQALSAANVGLFSNTTGVFKTSHEVLAMFVEFVPTFFVPLNAIASILSDEARDYLKSKGRPSNVFRRYRFFFDMRVVDNGRYEMRLREDVQHPRRGVADQKFQLADIGENAAYAVLPEYVTSLESMDSRQDVNVNVTAVLPPPSLHVRLQERVPVMERLRAMIPVVEFVPMDELAERIPEDILTHPYFDSQGGLPAIASKFPDAFQVVEGQIRIRPPELAPLALDDFTFDTSPEPDVIAIVKKAVCASDIPVWVSITGLYEMLPMERRRSIKRGYKSFASFLRAHGKSLALSNDLLRVSLWIPPRVSSKAKKDAAMSIPLAPECATSSSSSSSSSSPSEEGKSEQLQQQQQQQSVQFTQLHVLNELYDRFPRGKELTLHEFMQGVPEHLRGSLPKNPGLWLCAFPQYFVVEGAATTRDPSDIRIRRARDHAPVDLALQLYPLIPDDGIAVVALEKSLPPALKAHIDQFGIHNIVEHLPEWLELLDGDLFRKKTLDELEAFMSGKSSNAASSSATAPPGASSNGAEKSEQEDDGIDGVRQDATW